MKNNNPVQFPPHASVTDASVSGPQSNVEAEFEASDRRDVRPRVPGQQVVNRRVLDASALGNASDALSADNSQEVQSEDSDDLGNGVAALLAGPVGAAGPRSLALGSAHVESVWGWEASLVPHPVSVVGVGHGGRNQHLTEAELDLAKRIDSYVPQLKPEYWAAIEPFVRAAIHDAQPDRWSTAQVWLSNTAHLVHWCRQTAGIELTREAVFAPAAISRYVNQRDDMERSSQGTMRSSLLRVSERLIGIGEPTGEHRRYANSRGQVPYKRVEVTALRSFVFAQSTEHRRRNCRVIVALGAGAGLLPSEMMAAYPEHVIDNGDSVVVNVQGSRKRAVPVIAEWDDMVRLAVADAEPGTPLLLSTRGRFRSIAAVTDFLYSCEADGDLVRPHTQRLRSTWLVAHMNAGTPLPVLLEAAGLSQMSTLGRYLQYLAPVKPTEASALLRLVGKS